MKTTITIEIDQDEYADRHITEILKRKDMAIVITEFAEHLRQERKYGTDEQRVKVVEDIESLYFNTLYKHGIELEQLF